MIAAQFCDAQIANKNYAVIEPGDTEQQIIAKAAGVTPSALQLRWKQLELTVFFHFGVNTYTDREWRTGKESHSIFMLMV